ncbi:helix-turn-helix transcriptional regulator [soil metagenome]
MVTISTSIREHRARLGLTQEALAEQVGAVRQTIAYLEKGEYMPSLALAWRLAAVLGVPLTELFTLAEEN